MHGRRLEPCWDAKHRQQGLLALKLLCHCLLFVKPLEEKHLRMTMLATLTVLSMLLVHMLMMMLLFPLTLLQMLPLGRAC